MEVDDNGEDDDGNEEKDSMVVDEDDDEDEDNIYIYTHMYEYIGESCRCLEAPNHDRKVALGRENLPPGSIPGSSCLGCPLPVLEV